MGPGGRDPMFPGARFRPVQDFMQPSQAQGAPMNGMPPQAQGNAYGVPFVGLGNPANPASQPAPQPAPHPMAKWLQVFGRGRSGEG
jgi:hypothetical protein